MSMQVETPSAAEATVVMTRLFDAPREMVWRALTEPEHARRWFGGDGFSSPRCEMDVRPGGIWRHTMRVPDGTDFELEYEYLEVVKPEKLVWQSTKRGKEWAHGRPTCRITVTLKDEGRKTRWRLIALFDDLAKRDEAVNNGFATVISQGCERLNDIVKAM